MCRYRRASSRRASRGSTSGGGTVQMIGLSGAVPPHKDCAGWYGAPEPVGVSPGCAPHQTHCHPVPTEGGVQASREDLRFPRGARIVRQPPEREDGDIACRDDVSVVSRTPELDEGRVLPGRRFSPLDTSVNREERGSRHTVLQARPRRPPQRTPSGREPLIESPHPPPEGKDLRASEVQTTCRHLHTPE